MIILSITGLVRTLLIILGVFLILRFLGRFMVAKRNMEENERLRRKEKKTDEMVERAQRNFGKTTISKIGKSKLKEKDYTDFEEISED